MPEGLEHIVAEISANPQRTDLLAGFIVLCRTDKNPMRQADSLITCSKGILSAQPLLALKLLQVALGVAPKHPAALAMAKEIFKRRGRWAAEQRIAELMSTLTQTSALTPLTDELKASVVETVTQVAATKVKHIKPIPLEQEPIFVEETPLPVEVKKVEQAQPVLPDSEQGRVQEYLRRCGFETEWANLASGFSKNNAGLISFVGMLVGLNMIKAEERPLAGVMLLKMINEKPDDSGEQEILERLFPDLVAANREGK